MKKKIMKAADVLKKILCAVSALGIVWIVVSTLCVKSARSEQNDLPAWNYFSVIQTLSAVSASSSAAVSEASSEALSAFLS